MKILLNAQIPRAIQLLTNHDQSLSELYEFARNLNFDNRGENFKSLTPLQWIETSVNRTLLLKKQAEMGLAQEMPELEPDERHLITLDDLKACLGKRKVKQSCLVKALSTKSGCGQSTAWSAISKGGYLYEKLKQHGNGDVSLKEGV